MTLEHELSLLLGAPVDDLRRLTGGASRTTYAFGSNGRRLILRTGPPDEVHAGMELEAAVQRLDGAQGAPVPEILAASNSAEPLGNPYLICTEIPGETIVRKIYRGLDNAGRAALLTQCAAALAATVLMAGVRDPSTIDPENDVGRDPGRDAGGDARGRRRRPDGELRLPRRQQEQAQRRDVQRAD